MSGGGSSSSNRPIAVDDPMDTGQEDIDVGFEGAAIEQDADSTWDVLKEDEEGSLVSLINNLQQQAKRRRLKDTRTIRRGIIRHLFVVLDLSSSMEEKDLAPSRVELAIDHLQGFILEYFDQNPISQLGVIVTRDGLAEKLTELSGNPSDHIRALKENSKTVGEPSLQNALEMAKNHLSHVPRHGTREILAIYASLTTCDPGNIFEVIKSLKEEKIQCSAIGLAAELQLYKNMAKETGGTFAVVVNETHFRELLFEHISPPAVTSATTASSLVSMGFPTRKRQQIPTLCACHNKATKGGYVCPKCNSKVCEVPTECPICSLTLVSSPHLARSYHHLFPVQNFKEMNPATAVGSLSTNCISCQLQFDGKEVRYACPACQRQYCVDCDVFIHEVLHNCVGCNLKT